MVHVPSPENYQELLRVPHLVRLTRAQGEQPDELTLLVKCTSLHIKYVLQGARVQLLLFNITNGVLCYAFQIWDDPNSPLSFWSTATSLNELALFRRLVSEKRVLVYLFNEACINVAWADARVSVGPHATRAIETGTHSSSTEKLPEEVGHILERVFNDSDKAAKLEFVGGWKFIHSTYITNRLDVCDINFLGADEGSQQEELIRWLTDELQPSGAIRSPQLHEPSGNKELTDILLTCAGGTFIIESKTLSLLTRSHLPDRDKLGRDSVRKAKDAIRQLRTASRKLHDGVQIFDKATGEELVVERVRPIHAMCLVPDLSLVRGIQQFGRAIFVELAKRNGDFLHFLDTVQLFRVVQAAHMLSKTGQGITRMMALDYYLIKMFEFAVKIDAVDFDMAIDLRSDPPRIRFRAS